MLEESPNVLGFWIGLVLVFLMVNAPEPFATIADILMLGYIVILGAYLFTKHIEGE